MPKFNVRIVGTVPVWADVEVEADTAKEAYRKVREGEIPGLAELFGKHHAWEFCEGGNGVNDWEASGDVSDAEGEPLMEDFQWLA